MDVVGTTVLLLWQGDNVWVSGHGTRWTVLSRTRGPEEAGQGEGGERDQVTNSHLTGA